MGGRSGAEKRAERRESELESEQSKREDMLEEEKKMQQQDLLRRKLGTIRQAQGGSGVDTSGLSRNLG